MEVGFISKCEVYIVHLWVRSSEASEFWTLICQVYKIVSQAAVFIWANRFIQLLHAYPALKKILDLSTPFITETFTETSLLTTPTANLFFVEWLFWMRIWYIFVVKPHQSKVWGERSPIFDETCAELAPPLNHTPSLLSDFSFIQNESSPTSSGGAVPSTVSRSTRST
jgi:hypothetical protein